MRLNLVHFLPRRLVYAEVFSTLTRSFHSSCLINYALVVSGICVGLLCERWHMYLHLAVSFGFICDIMHLDLSC
ncbi:hypothetical protein P3S67_024537 [Capsicum chacoense]